MIWRWSSLAVRMKRVRGVPRADVNYCLPSRRLAGLHWRNEVLLRAERYHSRFSNSEYFLILFCKEFHCGKEYYFLYDGSRQICGTVFLGIRVPLRVTPRFPY